MNFLILIAVLGITLTGCGTTKTYTKTYTNTSRSVAALPEIQNIRLVTPEASFHTVRKGETLWRISRMYGVDIDELVRVNSLEDKSSVETGQVLEIPSSSQVRIPVRDTSPASAPEARAVEKLNVYTRDTFIWPLKGDVISRFGEKMDQARNKGIDIRSYEGKDIRSSRQGTVVFCDDQMKGFGKTVIIDHGDNYQTVYAYNSQILVKVGDSIPQNTVIAKVGRTGRAKEASLHFEIRKNGEPRDPYFYLPK